MTSILLLLLTLAATGEDPTTNDASATYAAEIDVTATAGPRETGELPYVVHALDDDGWSLRFDRTLPEAMAEIPGVMVQKTGHGQGSPFVRGFTGFRNLFLIDGIRLNNSVFRDGPNQYWSTVDPLAVERLEVVKGPVSVLYGSDAIGATVQALPLRPPLLGSDGTLAARLHYRYASAEDSHVGRLAVGGRAGRRTRFTAGASVKRFGDVEAGGDVGVQPRTGYGEEDADFRGEIDLGPRRHLVVGLQHAEIDDAWRTHSTVFAVPWEGTQAGDELRRSLDQRRTLAYLQLRQEADHPLFHDLHASVSFHRQAEERFRLRSRERRDRQGFDVGTWGAFLRLSRPSRVGRLAYGFEVYRDEVSSFSHTLTADGEVSAMAVQGPVADDATYEQWGVYLQDEIEVGSRTRLLAGVRHNVAAADARRVADPETGEPTSLDGSWQKTVGSLRALHRLGAGEHWTLFGGISQGFRSPNLSDLTRLDTARSSEIETPAPDLEPESFVAYELGLRRDGPRTSSSVALFYTDIADMIVRVPTGRALDGDFEVTKRNAGDGFVQGVELTGRARLGERWSLIADATWLAGEVDTFPTSEPLLVREPVDRLMPPSAHLGLRWTARDGRTWLELAAAAADRQDRLSSRDRDDLQRIPPGGTPGYVVVDLRGGWHLRPDVVLVAAIENLGDTEYRVHGSGLNEPGRSLVLGIDLGF